MVTAFGFFEPKEVLVEILLVGPGGAVDALQLGVPGIAAPIGARYTHQLESLAEIAGRGQMRPDTQIDKPTLPIQADLLVGRNFAYIISLIAFADIAKEGDRRAALPDLPGDPLVAVDDLAHPGLDPLEVLRRERLGTGEVVIKPGVRRRAERDLGVRIEFLDRLGHDMGGVVAEDLKTLRRVARYDGNRSVAIYDRGEVARPAVDPNGDRRLGEARSDRRREVGAGHRKRELAAAAVGQGHRDRVWHVGPPGRDRALLVVLGLLDHRAGCSVVIGRSDGANWSRKTPSVGQRGHSG